MLPARFSRTFVLVVVGLVILTSLLMFHEPTRRTYFDPYTGHLFDNGGVQEDFLRAKPPVRPPVRPPASVESLTEQTKELEGVRGEVIMSRLGNKTAKQALGRATWKLLHTMTLRFPKNPTDDERHALESYFHLLSRLYPCGECAAELQKLLEKYPPQTSSRRAAALWLCHLHNQVNERLGKPEFNCADLDGTYDCGCGDTPILEKPQGSGAKENGEHERDELTGAAIIKGGRLRLFSSSCNALFNSLGSHHETEDVRDGRRIPAPCFNSSTAWKLQRNVRDPTPDSVTADENDREDYNFQEVTRQEPYQ